MTGPSECAEQDVKDGAGGLRIPVEEMPKPLRHRENPLPDRDRGNDVVGEVGGRGRHAPRSSKLPDLSQPRLRLIA